MTTPFPLLRLPRLALIPVLQQMESIDLIAFSLLSNKAKNLVKMLCKITAGSISMVVRSRYPRITINSIDDTPVGLSLYTERGPDVGNKMIQNKTISCEKGSLTVAKLVERIASVTSCESLEFVVLRGPLQLEVCDTLAQLTKLWRLYISEDCSDSFAKKALEIVSKVTTEILLGRIPFENKEEFQTFLKSNLNYLCIYSCFSRFTLDDLLVTNAFKVTLREVKLSVTDISQFLTNWFHSKCNSRLEHLSLLVDEVVNEMCLPRVLNAVPFPRNRKRTFFYLKQLGTLAESFSGGYDIKLDGNKCDPRLEHLIVSLSEKVNVRNFLEGLKWDPFPRDRVRWFNYSKQLDILAKSFSGGYDIKRADGKKATIRVVDGQTQTFIDFYVWP